MDHLLYCYLDETEVVVEIVVDLGHFLKELYKFNSFFPKLNIHFYTDDYRGVMAKNDIYKNEIIMTIPKECLISLETGLNTSYGKNNWRFYV